MTEILGGRKCKDGQDNNQHQSPEPSGLNLVDIANDNRNEQKQKQGQEQRQDQRQDQSQSQRLDNVGNVSIGGGNSSTYIEGDFTPSYNPCRDAEVNAGISIAGSGAHFGFANTDSSCRNALTGRMQADTAATLSQGTAIAADTMVRVLGSLSPAERALVSQATIDVIVGNARNQGAIGEQVVRTIGGEKPRLQGGGSAGGSGSSLSSLETRLNQVEERQSHTEAISEQASKDASFAYDHARQANERLFELRARK